MIDRLLRLAPYFAQQRARLAAILALSLVLSASSVIQPWPMKVLVDYGLGLGRVAANSTPLPFKSLADLSAATFIALAALATLGLFALSAALDASLSWLWMATGQRMVYSLAADVYNRLLHLPLNYHRRHHVGDHLERISGDTWAVYTLASNVLVSPAQQTLTLVGVGWVSWQIHPLMAALSMTAAPIVAISVRHFGPRLKRRAAQGREIRSQLSSFVQQTMAAMPMVQAFGAEQRNQIRFASLVDEVVSVSQRGVLINKSFALVNGFANSAARAAVLFYGSLLVLNGQLSPGSLILFLAYVGVMQSACTQLLDTYAKLRTTEASIDRLLEILDEPRLPEAVNARVLECSKSACRGLEVRIDRVCFEYLPGQPVLTNVSLTVPAGRRVAIVGESGGGKSTLVALIPRLMDPTDGEVQIAGIDSRRYTLGSLRSQVAVLTQEPFLLPLTVAENIAFGKRGAGRDEVIAAAKAAQADSFIERLPQGYDTVLGQRGATLSGGQKQRLAIARALIRDSPILILDEPTSALDVATERELMTAFERLAEGRTTIMISHRLSTVRNADEIVVLNKGRVVESGTHDELMAARGHYSRFHDAQTTRTRREVLA